MDEILRRIGQLFVLGFSGEVPSTEFLDFVGEEQVGGVILFEANCPTYATARESIRRISERLETPPFVAVDQEGGRVCRLRGAPAEFKSAAEYGRNNSIEHFREDYRRSVVAMTSLGFNLNLAPVADIHLNKKSACLDGRCFGYDPARVAEFVRVSVAVAHSQGMLCCLKHFPGLGAASIDPHEATATAAYDRMLWQQRERIPFAAGVEAGADFVMSTHMIAEKLDRGIVTGSREIITNLVRDDLNFDGPVITDDLSMKGSEMLGDYGRRAVAAFNAGHDLLMFCHDFEATLEAFEYFAGAVRSGEIDPERVNTALDRVSGVKLKLGRPVLR
jgi:beta-N-acetylhexosaminidase